jgi:hypothetical protein
MKITEVITKENAAKPPSPDQARLRTMKQGIARQKVALASEKKRQQDVEHAQKMTKLRAQTTNV